MDKVDQKKMVVYSYILLILSLISLVYISVIDCKSPLIITWTFSLFIIGQIVPTIVLFPMALNYLPQAKGRTAAIIQGGRLILSSLALQVAGYYYTGSFQNIGAILVFFISITIVLLAYVIKSLGSISLGCAQE